MAPDKSNPATLHGQINTLAMQAGKLRDTFIKKKPRDLPANTIEDLNNLADTLNRIGDKIQEFEAEKSNSMALAKIGGVVNS